MKKRDRKFEDLRTHSDEKERDKREKIQAELKTGKGVPNKKGEKRDGYSSVHEIIRLTIRVERKILGKWV